MRLRKKAKFAVEPKPRPFAWIGFKVEGDSLGRVKCYQDTGIDYGEFTTMFMEHVDSYDITEEILAIISMDEICRMAYDKMVRAVEMHQLESRGWFDSSDTEHMWYNVFKPMVQITRD